MRQISLIGRHIALNAGKYFLLTILAFGVINAFFHTHFTGLSTTEKPDLWEHIVNSLYFSVVSMTTLGFGDITPITLLGKLLLICQPLLGLVLFGCFLNNLANNRMFDIHTKEKNQQQEINFQQDKHKLRAANKLVSAALDKSIDTLKYVINPDFTPDKSNVLDDDFEFHMEDLKNLYHTSVSDEDCTSPAIHVYLHRLKAMHKILIQLAFNDFWHNWEKQQDLIIKFTNTLSNFERFHAAFFNKNTRVKIGAGKEVPVWQYESDLLEKCNYGKDIETCLSQAILHDLQSYKPTKGLSSTDAAKAIAKDNLTTHSFLGKHVQLKKFIIEHIAFYKKYKSMIADILQGKE